MNRLLIFEIEGGKLSIYVEKNKKTKQLIQQSFIEILETQAFDTIKIGDITKKANINRGTFYLHFQDKYDLLDKMEQQLFEELGIHIDKLQSTYAFNQTFEKTQVHLAMTLFSFIQMHAQMLRVFLSGQGRAGFHFRFREAFTKKVHANLAANESIKQYLNVPMDYFLSFITSAFLGLIEQWVHNDLNKTPEEMTQIYISIIEFIKQK